MFEPIDGRKQSDLVAHRIGNAIIDGALLIGDRLPSERALIWQLSVSRPTIRDGVRQLVDAGVLEVRAGAAGTIVASDDVPLHILLVSPTSEIGDIAGILESRRMLEPEVTRTAAHYARDADLVWLQALIERMRHSGDTPDELSVLDTYWRIGIARATGNRTLVRLTKQLAGLLWGSRELLPGRAVDEAERFIDTRQRTLNAMQNRDAEAAARIVDEDIALRERAWRRTVGRTVMRPQSPAHPRGQ